MKMKIIYLCGPINGRTNDECKSWRHTIKYGLSTQYEFIDPMRNDYRGREGEYFSDIVHSDKTDVENADIILAMAQNPSWGTAMEIFYAHSLNKPVVGICDKKTPSPWILYHCGIILKTVEDAITYLRDTAKYEWVNGKQ